LIGQESTSPQIESCVVCGQSRAVMPCIHCEETRYCSVACAKSDWHGQGHEQECRGQCPSLIWEYHITLSSSRWRAHLPSLTYFPNLDL
jgi:hypothetical protein